MANSIRAHRGVPLDELINMTDIVDEILNHLVAMDMMAESSAFDRREQAALNTVIQHAKHEANRLKDVIDRFRDSRGSEAAYG